jgi:hypothetical protein
MTVLVFDIWDKALHGSEVWQHGVCGSMACTATCYIIGLATQYRVKRIFRILIFCRL